MLDTTFLLFWGPKTSDKGFANDHRAQISTNRKILSVHGRCITRITKVYRKTTWRDDQFWEDWSDILNLDLTDLLHKNEVIVLVMLENIPTRRWDPLVRVLLLKSRDVYEPPPNGMLDDLRGFLKMMFSAILLCHVRRSWNIDLEGFVGSEVYNVWRSFYMSIQERTWGRFIIALDDGRLALSPDSAREGDEIFLVQGCPMYMILRSGQDQYHEVVGPMQISGHYDKDPGKDFRSGDDDLSLREVHLR